MINLIIKPLKNGCYSIKQPTGFMYWILRKVLRLRLVDGNGISMVQVIEHPGGTYERVEQHL